MVQHNAEEQPQVVQSSKAASPENLIINQPGLAPEQLNQIKQICRISPYIALERDKSMFACLNYWRDLKICGKIVTLDTLGLAKALEVYVNTNTKQKGGLIQIPASTVFITAENKDTEKDILLSILKFLLHPILCGKLRDLKNRVKGTLEAYKVKNIIVNNAHYLSYSSLNELMSISQKLQVPVVLTGLPYLDYLLDGPKSENKNIFINIKDKFRDRFTYESLSQQDIKSIVLIWEREALRGIRDLNLADDTEIIKRLYKDCDGKLELLYIGLRKVADWYIKNPKAQINHLNVNTALSPDFKLPMKK